MFIFGEFQHTAARRRLGRGRLSPARQCSFNTQPPEGGWASASAYGFLLVFQHTAARRRLGRLGIPNVPSAAVSTHSRPKAAGRCFENNAYVISSFNTQPPEGGWTVPTFGLFIFGEFQHTAARRRLARWSADLAHHEAVSTHSRPKAAGRRVTFSLYAFLLFQHTAARRRLAVLSLTLAEAMLFQHTAARRRLG